MVSWASLLFVNGETRVQVRILLIMRLNYLFTIVTPRRPAFLNSGFGPSVNGVEEIRRALTKCDQFQVILGARPLETLPHVGKPPQDYTSTSV